MIKASEKSWNSPATLYLARRLETFAGGKKISVLDMGCGDGTVLEYLLDYDFDLYGYDLPESNATIKNGLISYFGASYDRHIRIAQDDRSIPFDDDSFDVIYANQVFEHIRFLEQILKECSRVLKPEGILLSIFPPATSPIEPHIGIPLAHWIPPGKLRIQYLRLFYAIGSHPKAKGSSALETAIQQDIYLKEKTFYRFINEIWSLSKHYFESCEWETNLFIQAKLDLLAMEKKWIKRWFGILIRCFEGDSFNFLFSHLINSVFCMKYPLKSK